MARETMKTIVSQCCYKLPAQYPWIARNHTGILNGFMNPPIRDYNSGEWQDSVTGDYGYFIPFEDWDKSVREVSTLADIVEVHRNAVRKRQTPKKKGSTDETV
jgi:hypothetical protein